MCMGTWNGQTDTHDGRERNVKKTNVETHYDRYGSERLPAVNVKVHGLWDWHERAEEAARDHGASEADAKRFAETAQAWTENDLVPDWLFSAACESEAEYLAAWVAGDDGDGLFPDHNAELELQGRSGGWGVVRGLPELESWDAIMLTRWAKFAKVARSIADDVPYQMASLAWLNIAEPELEHKRTMAREAFAYVGQ